MSNFIAACIFIGLGVMTFTFLINGDSSLLNISTTHFDTLVTYEQMLP